MTESYSARLEQDDRERRVMRDTRDQRYGGDRRSRADEQYDERFEAQGGGHSFNRDNEYEFDANRGRGGYGGQQGNRREMRSHDDLYGRGQSTSRGAWYPQQQSFERAGYDPEGEYWEGQRSAQFARPERFGEQGSEFMGRGGERHGYEYSMGASGYGSPRAGWQSARQGSGANNDWQRERGGDHRSVQRTQPDFAPPANYWEHGGGYRSGQRTLPEVAPSGNYGEHGAGGYRLQQSGQHDFGGAPAGYWRQQGGSEMLSGSMGRGAMRNRPPKGYTRSDERLREDICEQLMVTWYIDASEVSVEVKDGKVVLEGTVPERSMKHRIEDIAEQCSGVKDVDNRIRVSRDSGSASGSASAQGSSGQGSNNSTEQSGAGANDTYSSKSK